MDRVDELRSQQRKARAAASGSIVKTPPIGDQEAKRMSEFYQSAPSYLNESSSLIRYVNGFPASRWMSCSTTRATRRSRRLFDAVVIAAAAAFSQDSVLVPITSITLYTLSTMAKLLSLDRAYRLHQRAIENNRR